MPQTIEGLEVEQLHQDSPDLARASNVPQDWFLTNEMTSAARQRVEAGSKPMMAHAIFTPGQPGWLENLEHALSMKPGLIEGYTIGDNTNKDKSVPPRRMDDEKVAYKGHELVLKHGTKTSLRAQGPVPLLRGALAAAFGLLRRGKGGQGLAIIPPIAIPAVAPPSRGWHEFE